MDTPTDREALVAEIKSCADTIQRIEEAADNRTFTRSQQADVDANFRRASELLDQLDGIGDTGFAALAAQKFRDTGNPDYARQAVQAAGASHWSKVVAEFRGTRKDPTTVNPADIDLRDLISDAARYGSAGVDVAQDDYQAIKLRALSSSSDTVPTTFVSSLAVYEREAAPVMQAATVTPRPYARDIIFPRLTADITSASTATAELGGITEDDAVLSSVTASVCKLAVMQVASNELLRDSGVTNLETELAKSAGRALGYKANNWFTVGTGSGMPHSLASRATLGGTAQGTAFDASVEGSNFYSWGDVVDLQGYVPSAILPRAAYMTSPAGLRAAMKWRDNTGQPIFEPAYGGINASAGPAGRLFGYDVWVNSDVPSPGSAVKGWYFSRHAGWSTDSVYIRVIREVASELPDVTAIAYQVAADT